MYDRVVIPSAVLAELAHPKAPAAVKTWAGSLPTWAEVRTAAHDELDDILDPGEAEAIILAEQLKADSLLLDEMEARREALRRGLPVAGTVGVLEKAAERNLINLSEAFSKLARTSFYIAPQVLQQALQRDAANRKK
jgi:predicted nucleic acid-binding protein